MVEFCVCKNFQGNVLMNPIVRLFNNGTLELSVSFPKGIVVKVMHKKLGERYYRLKGVVEGVKDLYTAVIKMKDSGDKIKIDQAHLETVIPAIGVCTSIPFW